MYEKLLLSAWICDQSRYKNIFRHWLAKQVALPFVTPQQSQKSLLLLGFYAFSNHSQLQVVRQSDNRHHQRGVVWIAGRPVNKGTIQFHVIDWQLFQITERRIPGTEVINRYAHAQCAN